MRKLLQNPKFVIVITPLALIYLYWNLIHPFVSSPSSKRSVNNENAQTTIPEVLPEALAYLNTTENPNLDESPPTEANSNYNSQGDLGGLGLSELEDFLNVNFEYTRDPFKKQKRGFKSYTAFDFLPRDEQKRILAYKKAIRAKKKRKYRAYKSSTKSKTKNGLYPNLQAVAIGPEGKIAIINGKTVKVSESTSNTLDTITIIQSNNKNHFVFKP